MLAAIMLLSTAALAQTRRRPAPKRKAPVSKPVVEKSLAALQAGRERISSQVKTLSQFLYLYGGIIKGIESADQAARSGGASSIAMEQNERIKTRVKESIKNVREGLDKLEVDFRSSAELRSFYAYISGVARVGETAETQAAANRFDEAGRSLLKAVNQLADALAAIR
jgi:hypothetical protein